MRLHFDDPQVENLRNVRQECLRYAGEARAVVAEPSSRRISAGKTVGI
jgi:hypothetical protein